MLLQTIAWGAVFWGTCRVSAQLVELSPTSDRVVRQTVIAAASNKFWDVRVPSSVPSAATIHVDVAAARPVGMVVELPNEEPKELTNFCEWLNAQQGPLATFRSSVQFPANFSLPRPARVQLLTPVTLPAPLEVTSTFLLSLPSSSSVTAEVAGLEQQHQQQALPPTPPDLAQQQLLPEAEVPVVRGDRLQVANDILPGQQRFLQGYYPDEVFSAELDTNIKDEGPSHVDDRQLSQTRNDACNLLEGPVPISLIQQLSMGTAISVVLGEQEKKSNAQGPSLVYARLIHSQLASNQRDGSPVMFLTPEGGRAAVLEGSGKRALLLDVLLPPYKQLVDAVSPGKEEGTEGEAPPQLLEIALTFNRLPSGIPLLYHWGIPPSVFSFASNSLNRTNYDGGAINTTDSEAERCTIRATLLPPGTARSPLSVVGQSGEPYRCFVLLMPRYATFPSWTTELTVGIFPPPAAGGPGIVVPAVQEASKLVKWAVSGIVALLGSITLLLMVATGVYIVDPKMLGGLLRSLGVAEYSFTLNRWVAWLEEAPVPRPGRPDTPDGDEDEALHPSAGSLGSRDPSEPDQQLQMTLLNKTHDTNSPASERTRSAWDAVFDEHSRGASPTYQQPAAEHHATAASPETQEITDVAPPWDAAREDKAFGQFRVEMLTKKRAEVDDSGGLTLM